MTSVPALPIAAFQDSINITAQDWRVLFSNATGCQRKISEEINIKMPPSVMAPPSLSPVLLWKSILRLLLLLLQGSLISHCSWQFGHQWPWEFEESSFLTFTDSFALLPEAQTSTEIVQCTVYCPWNHFCILYMNKILILPLKRTLLFHAYLLHHKENSLTCSLFIFQLNKAHKLLSPNLDSNYALSAYKHQIKVRIMYCFED